MSQLDYTSEATSTSSMACAGTQGYAFSASSIAPSPSWIIDSGASYRMTGMTSLFSSYCVCFDWDKVQILVVLYFELLVSGVCLFHCLYLFHLCFMFLILNIILCLLVTSQNPWTLVTFFPFYCAFEDLEMQQMIGRGCKEQGSYLMDGWSHESPIQRIMTSDHASSSSMAQLLQ